MALKIKRVSESVLPDRPTSPGRTRQPSEFDELIVPAYEAWQDDPEEAWFEVEFDGTKESFNSYVSELNRAVIHAGHGKRIRGGYNEETDRVTYNEEGIPVFWFQVRDKIKTGPRGPRKKKDADGNVIEDDENGSESESESDPVIGGENGESKSGKRARKNLEASFSG